MQYRRANVKGGTYFFTVNLADRKSHLLIEHINDLRNVMRKVKQQHPFYIDAMVLPDHLHAMWTLPKDDVDYPTRWMLIKGGFSRCIPKTEHRRKSRVNKCERGIWQLRYWEHLIRDERDYERHVDYIHYNPVKHGYVSKPVEWQHTSVHRFIESEIIDHNWGTSESFNGDDYGERK